MNYRKVLIAVDFADEYQHVVDAGRRFANDDAEFHVVTVVRPLTGYYGGGYAGIAAEQTALFEQQAREYAQRKLEEVGRQLNVTREHLHLELGQPAPRIRALAEALDVDCIVIGTHGRHGVKRLLGSTASGVLHGVPCDALVVKVGEED